MHSPAKRRRFKMSESLLKNDDWFAELIVWADKNDISQAFFPRDIDQLLALTELRLIGCQLTKIPKAIGHLSQLTMLNLNNNQLKELPESIGNLEQLNMLYLTGTNIKNYLSQ